MCGQQLHDNRELLLWRLNAASTRLMYFIHLQECPYVDYDEDTSRSWIRSSVSVATRPEHTESLKYLDQNLTLVASLVSSNDGDTPCLVDSYTWQVGELALPIVFDITNINVIWPVRIVVCAENNATNKLAMSKATSMVCEARSDFLHAPHRLRATARIERRFILSNERVLRLWENSGLDPAQQLRYETLYERSTCQTYKNYADRAVWHYLHTSTASSV